MPWKCPVCGYENTDDANFCIRCGAQKPTEVQSTQPLQITQTPPPPPEQSPQQTPSPQVEAQQQAVTPPPPPPADVNQAPPSPQQAVSTPAIQQQVVTPPPNQIPPSPQQVTQKYYLLFIQTPYAGLINQKIPLSFDIFPSISVGRSPENVIIVPDPEVSRRHAVISLEGGELYIEDLNSTNGTYIYDGKLFQPVKGKQKISPNTIIKLGNQTIVKVVAE
ncbi:FHA domain-containing protein [Sulfolobus sp. S-194]|uniref:FHA domain-containing protein n=1 Tax=Sulfolobus sp. S-194 TaxID=2512240 RepID=UPI001437296B|nr:FHA domain-containing protein [Sulfolobus sp. S-194]QIW23687.1 FHA domain-containing protein [Sulfolobus sp. S-194]